MTNKPGRPKLKNKKVSVTVHLDPKLAATIDREAKKPGDSRSKLVGRLLLSGCNACGI